MARCQWPHCLRDSTHGVLLAGRPAQPAWSRYDWQAARQRRQYSAARCEAETQWCAWHATCTAVQRNAQLREGTS